MIARDTYKFYLSTAETHLILRALRELSENNDVRKPEKDSIMSLMNSMKLDIRAQEVGNE